MAVGVDGARQTVPVSRLGERGEVADRVLLGAERPAGHPPGRVVDPGHEGGEQPVRTEPAMFAAVDLEEHPLAWHPLPAAPMVRRAAGPGRPDRGLSEDPPEGPLGDVEALALGEELGEVGVVDPGIGRRGELEDPVADDVRDAVGLGPLTVAVDQAGRAVDAIAPEQAADLADRQVQDPGRLLGRQSPGQDMVEDVQTVLRWGVQGDRLPRVHAIEGDKVAGRPHRRRAALTPRSTEPRTRGRRVRTNVSSFS